MTDSLASLRKEYGSATLDVDGVSPDPIDQFGRWFSECQAAGVAEPNAMTLCTVGSDHRPSGRMVLLKGFDHGGFSFFTNLESRKARELASNRFASLVFWWHELERQVRIEGETDPLDTEAATAYFQTRPRESQLGAWASPQSQPVPSRGDLERRVRSVAERFPGDVPRPEHWGGFVLRPDCIEFWQGRPGRLHDRIRYRREDSGWVIDRLAP